MFRHITSIVTSITIVVIIFFAINKIPQSRPVANTKQLIIGMLPADAPFMSIDDHGNHVGFDVDVAKEVARRLGKRLIIKDMGVAELMVALERGNIEAMMCGLDITKQRQERFSMVHYQGKGVTTFPLVFWNKVPAGVTSIQDLRGKNYTVTLLPASTHEVFARQYDFINVKTMENYADIVLDLKYGKSHAAIFDEAISSYVKKVPELKVVNIPVGDFVSMGNGIAINKNNTVLSQQIAAIINEMKQEGIINRLERQWELVGQ